MAKLSQKEGIAVSTGVIVVIVFMTFAFSSAKFNFGVSSISADDTAAAQLALANQQAILDFEVLDLIAGSGTEASFGDTLYVHYVGQLENGDTFHTSTKQTRPVEVVLGSSQVITGWDLGLAGMKEGGTRRLVIPSELAYGDKDVVDTNGNVVIPGGETLTFDVVLLRVQKGN